MRITTRVLVAAAIAGSFAVLAAGCGGGGAGSNGGGPIDQVITINWGTEPPSLDPGLATDTTSADVLLNIMDPLVKLGDDLEPVPNLAKSWDISQDGKTVTFHLRDDGRWTNGDPVTAHGAARAGATGRSGAFRRWRRVPAGRSAASLRRPTTCAPRRGPPTARRSSCPWDP